VLHGALVREHKALGSAERRFAARAVGVLGVSGGGGLASGAAVFAGRPPALPASDAVGKVSSRPDVAVLVYPLTCPAAYAGFTDPTRAGAVWGVLSLDDVDLSKFDTALAVTPETPPTFLCHSTADTGVTAAAHSDPFFVALHKQGVEKEYVRCDFGSHGCGLVENWGRPAMAWLAERQYGVAATEYVYVRR
jgi:acetyl esterase/lipase